MLYKRGSKNSLILALLLLSLMVSMGIYRQPENQGKALAAVNPLPVVGSKEKLIELLKDSGSYYGNNAWVTEDAMPLRAAADQATVGSAAPQEGAAMNKKSEAYSPTNTQVQGVDESDIIKTDGSYIYQVNNNRILIIYAKTPDQMQIVSKLEFTGNDFTPAELYIDANKLMVIGHHTINVPGPCYRQNDGSLKCPPIYYNRQSTRVLVYDMQDRSHLKNIRSFEMEGSYLSSRKIGSTIYLVSNEGVYWTDDDIMIPCYSDSAAGSTTTSIPYNQLRYFPDHIYPGFINIAAINTAHADQKAQVESYLGNGENIYASTGSLYISASSYKTYRPMVKDSAAAPDQPTTAFYKFAFTAGGLSYAGKGEVPGAILNQFSMDENNGYFRVATTTGSLWGSGENISKNNVYILNSAMTLVGRLENIAPGEKIYSTRFMGDRAYMVTFRKVDPLFVIDMKDPAKPAILGKLKIPGYSDYLHPYDENHIIGFGKDTIETKANGSNESIAFYQGLKVALFDVSDVSNPKVLSQVIIGDRGSDSDLLSNHKALLFSREKNLLAFPATVMKIRKSDQQQYNNGFPAYGSFEFQGAYVYHIDLKNGLQLKGRISHLSQEDMLKAGDSWYGSSLNVERALYIGNNLYTLSQGKIQVNALSDLKLLGQLQIN